VPFRAARHGTIGTVTEREFLERMDRHLAVSNEHMAESRTLMEEIRQEMRLNREEMRLNREEHKRNQARFQNSQAVTREMLLELREGREILHEIKAELKDIGDGIRAGTAGLLHVLAELRRGNGPSAAGA
jgi:chromosome condensin MukBEF ATPase and DNA-binding subunit MukB